VRLTGPAFAETSDFREFDSGAFLFVDTHD
jgi:hypothetical protein